VSFGQATGITIPGHPQIPVRERAFEDAPKRTLGDRPQLLTGRRATAGVCWAS